MGLNREGRRTVAQFLNALAVTLTATLVLAPLAAGHVNVTVAAVALLASGSLHILAILIGGR